MSDQYPFESEFFGRRPGGETRIFGLRENPFWTWADAAVFVILLVPSYLFGLVITNVLFTVTPLGLALSKAIRLMIFQFSIYGIWFLALWGMFRMRYQKPFWLSMGWITPWRHFYATLIAGPVLVFLVAYSGRLMRTPRIDSSLDKLLSDTASILVIGLFAVTLGPLSEELVFRGFFQPLLIRSFGVAGGIALASLPFALLHGPQYQWSWRHMLLLFLASGAFGITRWVTRSTAASTLVHCAYNFTFFLGFVLQKRGVLY